MKRTLCKQCKKEHADCMPGKQVTENGKLIKCEGFRRKDSYCKEHSVHCQSANEEGQCAVSEAHAKEEEKRAAKFDFVTRKGECGECLEYF